MRPSYTLPLQLLTSVLLGLSLEGPALGQSRGGVASSPAPAALGDSLTGAAKDEYVAGRILFQNGDFSGALVKFQHAFDLSSDVRLLWDMGACEKNLRHYVRVLRLVERYMHDGDPRITEAQRAEAAVVVRTVRALVSELHLIANEAGASVFVDDEPVGTTPLMEPLLVDLGQRRIRVRKPGFKEQVIVQQVPGASELTVSVALERETHEGRIFVSTDAGGAIRLDGTAVGMGRWEGPVGTGSHTIGITAPGMRAYSTEVTVHDGESRILDVTLQHESGGISAAWWIGGGVLVAAGLGVGGYFLYRPSQTTAAPTSGTITPGTITASSIGHVWGRRP